MTTNPKLITEAIDNMAPGREMDALVSEHVLNRLPHRLNPDQFADVLARHVIGGKSFSTSWEAMGELADLLTTIGWEIGIHLHQHGSRSPVWTVECRYKDLWGMASADSAPHAFCRGILKAVLMP